MSRTRAHSSVRHARPLGRRAIERALRDELAREPRLGQRPSAFDGRGRDAERFGRLFNREPAEEADVHQMREIGIERGQAGQGFVERLEIERSRLGRHETGIERHPDAAAAAFRRAARASAFDQDLPHRPGGNAEEMRAVLPRQLRVLHQPRGRRRGRARSPAASAPGARDAGGFGARRRSSS